MASWRYGYRVLSRTFDYSGRTSCEDFRWWVRLLFRVLWVSFVAMVVITVLMERSVPELGTLVLASLLNSGIPVAVIGFLPTLALTVRRLHDTGRSGGEVIAWFVVPFFVWIVTLGVFFVTVGIGLVGGSPSPIPAYASLGVALATSLGVACRAIWLLSRDGEGVPNRFGSVPR